MRSAEFIMNKNATKFVLVALLFSTTAFANCLTINGEVYCNQNTQVPPLQYVPPQSYIPNIPYYPPPVYQPPQVIVIPQITPGNPNFQKFEYDTGRVIKRNSAN